MSKNYNATTTIESAVATIKPKTVAVPAYHTARSGLAVLVGTAEYNKERHYNMPAFRIQIDGTADRHDVTHLAKFFQQLAEAMPAT